MSISRNLFEYWPWVHHCVQHLWTVLMLECFSYFDDDNGGEDAEYQPAPGSPGQDGSKADHSDSDDPLDAFMEGIEVR